MMKLAMVRLHANLVQRRLPARILLQVHDELLLEVKDAGLEAVREAVGLEMEHVADMRVPLRVELKVGPNWGDLQTLVDKDRTSLDAPRSQAPD